MQFMLICCDSCTFVVVQEMSRFTRFGSQKTVNIGLRAKKTEFPVLIREVVISLLIAGLKSSLNSVVQTDIAP